MTTDRWKANALADRAEDEWAWACGWYIARVDTGEFTVNDVPDWCNYFVAPQVVCYDSANPGQLDFMLTGLLNTAGNVSSFTSLDGTCSGGVAQSETFVSALSAENAAAACQSLLGPGYGSAVSLRDSLGYDTPGSWWACQTEAT